MSAIIAPIALVGATGCQTYEPAPLDVAAHRAALERRTKDLETIEAFVARLDAAGAATPARFSYDDGLSPAEGEVVALFYNPDLRIQRLEAGVALATRETAGLWDDPVFGFDGAEILSPDGFPFEYGLTASLSIPISGRLEVEKDRAGAAYEAQLRAVVEREWSTRADVRTTWAQWTIAAEQAAVIRDLIEELEAVIALTDRLEAAGELSRADGRLFAVALANQRADLIEADANFDTLHADLLFLLGLPMDADLAITPGLSPVELPDLTADLDRILIERNPALAVRRAEYQTAEETLRLEIREQIPDIEIGGGYGNEDDDRLLLGVRVPIPILNANRQAIAEAGASRELSRALAETTYEKLSLELERAVIAYRQAAARRQEVETYVLALANEQLAELRRLAELGEVNTFLSFENLASLFEAKTRVLDLRLTEYVASVRIVELLGPAVVQMPSPVAVVQDDAEAPAGDDQ